MPTIRAHYDGKVLVPEEPLELTTGESVFVRYESVKQKPRSFRSLIGRAFDFPANPNPKCLSDDDLWKKS